MELKPIHIVCTLAAYFNFVSGGIITGYPGHRSFGGLWNKGIGSGYPNDYYGVPAFGVGGLGVAAVGVGGFKVPGVGGGAIGVPAVGVGGNVGVVKPGGVGPAVVSDQSNNLGLKLNIVNNNVNEHKNIADAGFQKTINTGASGFIPGVGTALGLGQLGGHLTPGFGSLGGQLTPGFGSHNH